MTAVARSASEYRERVEGTRARRSAGRCTFGQEGTSTPTMSSSPWPASSSRDSRRPLPLPIDRTRPPLCLSSAQRVTINGIEMLTQQSGNCFGSSDRPATPAEEPSWLDIESRPTVSHSEDRCRFMQARNATTLVWLPSSGSAGDGERSGPCGVGCWMLEDVR